MMVWRLKAADPVLFAQLQSRKDPEVPQCRSGTRTRLKIHMGGQGWWQNLPPLAQDL